MTTQHQHSTLSDAEIRAILDETKMQALGGGPRAVLRAGLGTIALVLAVFASTEAQTVGIILLCGALFSGLAVYIREVARALK